MQRTFKIIEHKTATHQLTYGHKAQLRASHPHLYEVEVSGLEATPNTLRRHHMVSADLYDEGEIYTVDGNYPPSYNSNLAAPIFFVDNSGQSWETTPSVRHGMTRPDLHLSGNFNIVAVTACQRDRKKHLFVTEGAIGKLDTNLKKQLVAFPPLYQAFFAEGRPVTLQSVAQPVVVRGALKTPQATCYFTELHDFKLAGTQIVVERAISLPVVTTTYAAPRRS